MGTDITFLSGLPRTGSTLLTSILMQNPKVHSEPNSALCGLLWDMHISCCSLEQIQNRPDVPKKMLKAIPEIFYDGIDKHIIDKCRTWTLPGNIELVKTVLNPNPKIIVMTRPVVDIVKSFVYIRSMNNWQDPEIDLLKPGTAPIMVPIDALKHAMQDKSTEYLFIGYDDLVSDAKSVIDKVYDFCGWDKYEHSFDDIKNTSREQDELLQLVGLHDIRPSISRRTLDIKLSDDLLNKAKALDEELGAL